MPIYETPRDIYNEDAVRDALIARYQDMELIRTPPRYAMDFAMLRSGKLVGWAEVKTRTCSHTEYDEAMISLSKVVAGKLLSDATGTKSHLFIKWTDRIGFVEMAKPDRIGTGGRTDRGDPNDFDLCAFFSINRFEFIEPLIN